MSHDCETKTVDKHFDHWKTIIQQTFCYFWDDRKTEKIVFCVKEKESIHSFVKEFYHFFQRSRFLFFSSSYTHTGLILLLLLPLSHTHTHSLSLSLSLSLTHTHFLNLSHTLSFIHSFSSEFQFPSNRQQPPLGSLFACAALKAGLPFSYFRGRERENNSFCRLASSLSFSLSLSLSHTRSLIFCVSSPSLQSLQTGE